MFPRRPGRVPITKAVAIAGSFLLRLLLLLLSLLLLPLLLLPLLGLRRDVRGVARSQSWCLPSLISSAGGGVARSRSHCASPLPP